jgi:hypothetical protein
MSDLINTNRLRISAYWRRYLVGRIRLPHLAWKSNDHGKKRLESTWQCVILGLCINVKWRPDGK